MVLEQVAQAVPGKGIAGIKLNGLSVGGFRFFIAVQVVLEQVALGTMEMGALRVQMNGVAKKGFHLLAPFGLVIQDPGGQAKATLGIIRWWLLQQGLEEGFDPFRRWVDFISENQKVQPGIFFRLPVSQFQDSAIP